MKGAPVDVRRLAAPGIGLVALALYWLSAYPDVAGGDSGELVAAAVTGGVIHPPGYPLYALAGRVASWLPLAATAAGRDNLLSAFCDAGAAALVCAAVSRRTASRTAGLAAGAAFAFAPIVWQYAICAEVFALNDLLVAVLLWLAVRYDEAADRRFALWGGLVTGLGLSNHHTFLFVAAPVAAWALWRGRDDLLRARPLLQLAGGLAAGLLPYAYLPLAAGGASPVSWGATATCAGFWTHVLRREYGTLHLAVEGIAGASSSLATLGAWGEAVLAQFAIVGVVLPLAGALVCLRAGRRAPLGAVVVAAAVLSVGVVVALGNLPVTDALHRQIVARFWQEPALLLAVLCGEGLADIERRAPRHLVDAAAALLLLAPLPWRFGALDRHGSTLVRSYGAEILRAAPPGALLVTKGDLITNTVRYLQSVEGVRPDVKVVDQELLGYGWQRARLEKAHPEVVIPGARYMPGAPDGFTIRDLFDASYGKQPILV
ncbi:MAG: protein O-mannosyl-transferase family, partial [Polyangiaceae bacterium]